MFDLGVTNRFLSTITVTSPVTAPSDKKQVYVDFTDLSALKGDYIHYKGSLTTPPCSEGVLWYLCKTVSTGDSEQLQWFQDCLPEDNARPVQPVNGRQLCMTATR